MQKNQAETKTNTITIINKPNAEASRNKFDVTENQIISMEERFKVIKVNRNEKTKGLKQLEEE